MLKSFSKNSKMRETEITMMLVLLTAFVNVAHSTTFYNPYQGPFSPRSYSARPFHYDPYHYGHPFPGHRDAPPAYPPIAEAICILQGFDIQGSIALRQFHAHGPVEIDGEISGLTPGKHGFHVHEYGDLSDGCKSAGGHFNPFQQPHMGPKDYVRHVGDLGNIEAGADGVAHVKISDPLVSLTSHYDVYGRAIVIHEKEDDLGRGGDEGSMTTGNAGGRLGCCIIAYKHP